MSLTIFAIILIGLCLAALLMTLFCEVKADDAIEEIIREEKKKQIEYRILQSRLKEQKRMHDLYFDR